MIGMGADAEMETFLPRYPHKIFVGANASCLKGFRGQLLVLVGNQVNT